MGGSLSSLASSEGPPKRNAVIGLILGYGFASAIDAWVLFSQHQFIGSLILQSLGAVCLVISIFAIRNTKSNVATMLSICFAWQIFQIALIYAIWKQNH